MSNTTLGLSERVLQHTPEQIREADLQLNTLLVKSFTYTTVGVLSGVALSLFFKNKIRIVGYSAGLGLGLGFHKYGSGLVNQICQ